MTNKKEFTINGKNFIFDKSRSRLDLIINNFLRKSVKKNIAVAVNDELVQKSEWSSTIINFGDRIEIVYPFNGG